VAVGLIGSLGLSLASADDPLPAGFQSHVVRDTSGDVDWTDGWIVATGEGMARAVGPQSQVQARRAATLIAARNALAASQDIPIDADGRIRDFPNGRLLIKGVIQGLEVAESEWHPEEKPARCRVTLRVPLWGVDSVSAVFQVQQLASAKRRTAPRIPLVEKRADVSDAVLVIDARGLGLRPCLYPVVGDNTGRVLHDVVGVKGSRVKNRPVVRYVESDLTYKQLAAGALSLEATQRVRLAVYQPQRKPPTSRPADRPPRKRGKRRRRVVVKAAAATGKQGTQVVLTRADAERLANNPEGASLLREGKVIVVVDSAAAGIDGRRDDPWRDVLLTGTGTR
jgi:hypothetical protein